MAKINSIGNATGTLSSDGTIAVTAGNVTLPIVNAGGTEGILKLGPTYGECFGNAAGGFFMNSAANHTATGNSIGLGYKALLALTNANSNICIGDEAGSTLTTGIENIAIGYSALKAASAASTQNIAIGLNANACAAALGCGDHNVVIGNNAAQNRIGSYNIFIGDGAQNSASTGSNNCAIGSEILAVSSAASDCVAAGRNALHIVSTGSYNCAYGSASLNAITTGQYNCAYGYISGSSLTLADSSNICIMSSGTVGDNNTIRIGTQGAGNGQQNKCYVAGIVGVTPANVQSVYVDSTTGQLGVRTTLYATGDEGGIASTNALSNVSDVTANGAGTFTIKSKSAGNLDSTGFIKVYIGVTAYYIPVFSAVAP